uniref:Putative conserved plasma membrane protein n=1 Tax=Panstrongylus lignarius TaxID=156445 RepID=A0A224XL28_9HEMI
MAYNVPGYVDALQNGQVKPDETAIMQESSETSLSSSQRRSYRYPYCIVWTPIPCITWLMPFIGHMGICTSSGIIRDFAYSYYVSEDQMAFGRPTRVWQLDPNKATGNWDMAISEAADVYKTRIHNLCCDNCHSMVALALNKMNYGGGNWNMVYLCFGMLFYGHFIDIAGFVKTVLPFCILVLCILFFILVIYFLR